MVHSNIKRCRSERGTPGKRGGKDSTLKTGRKRETSSRQRADPLTIRRSGKKACR